MITTRAYLSSINAEMTSADVLEVVQLLSEGSVEMHIDGGWGVDALLGRQTRPHEDLDIAPRATTRVQQIQERISFAPFKVTLRILS